METKEKNVVTEKKTVTECKKKKFKIQLPKCKLQTKIIIALSVALIVAVGGLLAFTYKTESQLTTVSKASLEKVLEISELSTVDYTYNAVATKYKDNADSGLEKDNDKAENEAEKEVMYYVAYNGTASAGIDFNEIKIETLDEEKKIVVTIPEVKIHSTKVDMGTMEFIFTKSKYETENITAEAFKLCKEDLAAKVEKEKLLKDTAKENAISAVGSLLRPWIETIDSSYIVEIK